MQPAVRLADGWHSQLQWKLEVGALESSPEVIELGKGNVTCAATTGAIHAFKGLNGGATVEDASQLRKRGERSP